MVSVQGGWRRDLAIALASLGLLLVWDFSGLDLALMRAFGGPQGFPWRDHWLTSRVLHDGVRVLSWGLVAVLIVNVLRPWSWSRGLTRAERVVWLLSTLACALLISWLKHRSLTSCPWSLTEFGAPGEVGYVGHWAWGRLDGGPGHCFPSGHASTGFALLPAWFALRGAQPRVARRWLAGAVLLGTVSGLTQLVRGAHYLSHTLWTAWCCFALAAVLHHLSQRWGPRPRPHAAA